MHWKIFNSTTPKQYTFEPIVHACSNFAHPVLSTALQFSKKIQLPPVASHYIVWSWAVMFIKWAKKVIKRLTHPVICDHAHTEAQNFFISHSGTLKNHIYRSEKKSSRYLIPLKSICLQTATHTHTNTHFDIIRVDTY